MFYDADFFARIVGSWHGNGIRLVGSCNGIRHWRHFGMSYQSGTLNWLKAVSLSNNFGYSL